MRVALYIENLLGNSGGAEIYAAKLAEAICNEHEVEIICIENTINNKSVEQVFNRYKIERMKVQTIYFEHTSNKLVEFINRIRLWYKIRNRITNKFDVFINCSANRMFGFMKLKCIHLIHFPVANYKHFIPVLGEKFNDLYRRSYIKFIANSNFTKEHLFKIWGVEGSIINPPIVMETIKDNELCNKENAVLMVGRLVPDKKHYELASEFLKFEEKYNTGYKLYIVGNKDTKNLSYYKKIQDMELSGKIIVKTDVTYDELVNYYKIAKIYWHAKGYQVDERKPWDMEHFGMTTVEAMANGCIPIVINKAGQKEIIQDRVSGFLWDSIDELFEYTLHVINCAEISCYQINAINRSKDFLYPVFQKKINKIMSEIENV